MTENDAPPTVVQAMSRVMADIGTVGKDKTNPHFKFQYRGIDDVYNAIHGPMTKHGVVVAPELLNIDSRTVGDQHLVMVTMRYRFYGPAGDYLDVVVPGEALDKGDKATSKALSAAMKYAFFQTFVVPTEDIADGDGEAPQRPPTRRERTVDQQTGEIHTSSQRTTKQTPPPEQDDRSRPTENQITALRLSLLELFGGGKGASEEQVARADAARKRLLGVFNVEHTRDLKRSQASRLLSMTKGEQADIQQLLVWGGLAPAREAQP